MEQESATGVDGQWQGEVLAWQPLSKQARGLLLVCFALLVAAGWWSYRQGWLAPELLVELANRHLVAAIVLFVLVYAACMMALLPTLPLNLAAGMLWGGLAGAVVASAGGGPGAALAFLLARRLLGRPLARKIDHRFLTWLQCQFEAGGWRFVAFVRLNPVFPTGPINYVFGLTAIRTSS